MFLLDEFVCLLYPRLELGRKKTDAPAIYCDLRGAINSSDVIIVVILLLPLRAYSFVLERHGVVIIRR
jgi:hypothetical protein